MNNKIIIQQTGEILNLDQKINAMTDQEKSLALTQINFIRKLTEKLEKKLKSFIKDQELEFDDDGYAYWQDHRLKQASRAALSKKAIYDSGNTKDIAAYEELERKYIRSTSYIKFG